MIRPFRCSGIVFRFVLAAIISLLISTGTVTGAEMSSRNIRIGIEGGPGKSFLPLDGSNEFSRNIGWGGFGGINVIVVPKSDFLVSRYTRPFFQCDLDFYKNTDEYSEISYYREQEVNLNFTYGTKFLPGSPVNLKLRVGPGIVVFSEVGVKDRTLHHIDSETIRAHVLLVGEFSLGIRISDSVSLGVFGREEYVAGRLVYLGFKDINGGDFRKFGVRVIFG